MRHLPAEAAPIHESDGTHLAVTAKVQIFAERSKPEGAPRESRGGAEESGIMIAKSAACIAN